VNTNDITGIAMITSIDEMPILPIPNPNPNKRNATEADTNDNTI
jgi:hypothetical protein